MREQILVKVLFDFSRSSRREDRELTITTITSADLWVLCPEPSVGNG